MKPGYERMHWLIDEAFDGDELSDTFLAQVLARSSYADGPLFAALQESIYGSGDGATGWAAEAERARHPEFAEEARPLLFTGEMMYPWMFEEIRVLRPFRAAVEALASRSQWSPLYDLDRLAANDVPVAAAVYFDDMYVDSGLQLDTAARVGNLQAWVTNEYEHDGLSAERVFNRLTELVRSVGGGVRAG
jgi:proline iminopeptidase